jgi:FKBP-type peptidyl-prolyl cis-trans isomerase SlyD
MEKIEPGKYVEMVYDLFVVEPDGEQLVHKVEPDSPERIIYGVTQGVIAPLEKAIEGLKKGDTFDVKVASAEGFGAHDPEQVAHLDKNIFVVEGKFDTEYVTIGNYIPMMTADGYRINGKVLEITDTEVVMDFNHPLAGKDVRFHGTIGEVREATQEELHPSNSGCGGCGGGCGDGGCGDGQCGCGGCQ